MDLAARRFARVTVLRPSGRIDHLTADRFKAALLDHLERQEAGHPVVLDLGGVEYMASTGLRALVLATRQLKARGGRLAVAALQPVVREVFEITRFTLVLDTFASVREAVAALAPDSVPAFEAAHSA